MYSSLIRPLTLKQQPHKYAPDFGKWRFLAELSHGKRVSRGGQLVDFIVAREVKVDFHSMDSNRIDLAHAALGAPEQPGIDAGNVRIAHVVERLVGQVYGLVEKGFVVHGRIIGGSGQGGHWYFPWWIAMPASSLFLAKLGYSNGFKH